MNAAERQVVEVIQAALQAGGFAPGDAIVVDAVVVAGWMDGDGDWCWSLVRCGSPWATRGLIDSAIESVEGEITAEADE